MRRGSAQLVAIVTLVVALLASVFLTTRLAASAGRHQLVYTDRIEGSMTREEALGVAAGAFRGMIVNLLWIRAHNLKQDGKYWESVDLAKSITKLQPRFPRVWSFHAWNLAYNISVTTQTPEERWQWVNSGVRLLRDEGIPANPNDMLLHKELAWIYLHKMQMRMDDANNKYKEWFAREWTIAVGPPPEGVWRSNDRAKNIEACALRLEGIAAAPDTIEELTAKNPKIAAAVAALKNDAGMDITTEKGRLSLLEFREYFRSASRRAVMLGQDMPLLDNAPPALMAMFTDRATIEEALNDILLYARKRVIIDTYHMEPDRMVRYTRKYGPLDWRHPATHAVYWAARGVEMGLNRVQEQTRGDYDFINTDRMVIHAVQELYRSGTVMHDIMTPQFFAQLPCPDYIDSYDGLIEELMAREDIQMRETKGVNMEERVFRFYMEGYENFLGDAIVLLFRRNQIDRANFYKNKMAEHKGRNKHQIERERIRNMPLEDYVLETMRDRESTPYVAVAEVFATLQSAFVYGLLAGDMEMFTAKLAYAQKFHKAFWEEQFRLTTVDRDDPRMSAMDVDFWKFAGKVMFQVIGMLGPENGGVIYRRAPRELQLWAYYLLESQAPRDDKGVPQMGVIGQLFPLPGGYAAFAAEQRSIERANEERRGKLQVK